MVKAISGVDNSSVQTVHQKTVNYGSKGLIIGAGMGLIEGYARKSWLEKDVPSDTFVKRVSKDLKKTLKPEEHNELKKVNDFFKQLINYKADIYQMRGKIEDSSELSNAVPKQNGETTKDALDRMFANPDKLQLKKELKDLQNNTKVDKKVNVYTARNIAQANFDSEKKVLKKANGTSDEVFGILKAAARKIKFNRAIKDGLIGGFLIGTAGLLIGAKVADNSKTTK